MNIKIQERVKEAIESAVEDAKRAVEIAVKVALGGHILEKVQVDFTDSVSMNFYGGMFWIDVYNREDLQAFMVAAPLWNKATVGSVIHYEAEVSGISFRITAHDAALPDTCQVVEEEVTIPAQPERVETRMVVRCNQPQSAEAAL